MLDKEYALFLEISPPSAGPLPDFLDIAERQHGGKKMRKMTVECNRERQVGGWIWVYSTRLVWIVVRAICTRMPERD